MFDNMGWAAYALIARKAGISARMLDYARPDQDLSGYFITAERKQEIVRIIDEEYKITLSPEDKAFILNMCTPKELCQEFSERFNPRFYPQLTSDRPLPDNIK